MRKKTLSEEQITLALRQAETGTPVTEVCRKMGVSEQSFYRMKDGAWILSPTACTMGDGSGF
jgi:hypothetical protein